MSSKNQMKRGKNQSLYKYLPETWIDFSVRGKERKQYIAKVERWNSEKLDGINAQRLIRTVNESVQSFANQCQNPATPIKPIIGFGAELTVAGRRPETEAWVRSSGIDYTSISAEESYSDKYDIIINTVPELILTKTRLDMLSKECLIVDLASTPGGTDFAHASALGIQAIHALSLPGKTAPISAGKALYDTIINI